MSTPPPDRGDDPRWSRRGTLAAGVAIVLSTAGCTDVFGDDASGDGPLADDAPEESAVLAHVEPDALDDEDLETLERVEQVHVERLRSLEDELGRDPLAADELVLFADAPDDEGGAPDVILEADWQASAVAADLEAVTDLAYERREFEGDDALFEPAESTADAPHLGILDEDRFVYGSESGVRAALSVRHGDREPVGGRLRDAYDDAHGGQLTVASTFAGSPVPASVADLAGLDIDVFERVEAVGRRYETVDAGLSVEVALHAESEHDAEDLERVVRGGLATLADLDESFDEAREDVALERTGSVVELTYRGEAAVVFDVLEEV